MTSFLYFRNSSLAPFLLFFLILSQPAFAHVTSTSYSTIELSRDEIRIEFSLNAGQLTSVDRSDANGDKRLDPKEAASALDVIQERIQREYYVRVNGFQRLELSLDSSRVAEDGTAIFQYHASLPQPTESIEVHASLDNITEPHHQHLMRVVSGAENVQYAFDHGNNEARIDPSQIGLGVMARAVQFIRLGVFHIFTGYDHLAFLAGLLITTVAIGPLVGIVTAFTVAHSMTLVLATLGIIVLPDRLVETAIPLTIAYVAVENIWMKSFDKRWRLTFFFGLVHGFGFSNVLRELALPRSALAVSLFSFNCGVELGQLAFVLLLFPMVRLMGRTRHYETARNVASFVILAFGIYWFATRLLA